MNFENMNDEELARYLRENPNEEFLAYFANHIEDFRVAQIQTIIENIALPQYLKDEILNFALLICNLGLVKFLFDNGAVLNNEASIFNCVSDNCFPIIKYLVEEQHIQIPKKALLFSVKHMHEDLTNYLLQLLYPETNITASQIFETIRDLEPRSITMQVLIPILEPHKRARALEEIKANEEKRVQAIQEYKTKEEKSPESSVQKVCSSSSQNSFLTGEELKDDDKIVIFFFEDNRVGAEEALKGDCYLVEELEMAYKSYLEEKEEEDGLKVPVCEWQGPPSPYGKGFRPFGRDPTKPVFRLPYSGAWVTGRTIKDILMEAKFKNTQFPIIVNLMGRKTSIGSYFGMSQLHGQWGGQWAKSTDEKGNTVAIKVNEKTNPGPDEREIVYEKMYINKILEQAVLDGNIEKVRLLLDSGADVYFGFGELLREATENNDEKMVEILLEYGAYIHGYDEPLYISCRRGYTNIVKLLLKYGVDIHADNDSALSLASANGRTKIVKLLLDNRADIHAQNDLSLRWASENGHTKTVKLLLDRGANIHANNDEALRLTSENGHTDIVKLLLDRGADIHAGNGWALRWASENRHTETVKLLLDRGAR